MRRRAATSAVVTSLIDSMEDWRFYDRKGLKKPERDYKKGEDVLCLFLKWVEEW